MGVVSSVEEHSFHTRVVAGSNPALHIMYFCVSGLVTGRFMLPLTAAKYQRPYAVVTFIEEWWCVKGKFYVAKEMTTRGMERNKWII